MFLLQFYQFYYMCFVILFLEAYIEDIYALFVNLSFYHFVLFLFIPGNFPYSEVYFDIEISEAAFLYFVLP